MIDVKTAKAKALEFASQVLKPEQLTDAQVEEVEGSTNEDQNLWLITVSFPSLSAGFRVLVNPREFKTFEVDRRTGEVVSMKIKSLTHA